MSRGFPGAAPVNEVNLRLTRSQESKLQIKTLDLMATAIL